MISKKYIGDQSHRQFITHYTPDTCLKPILVFSLLADIKNNTSELAVIFVGALNFHHCLEKMYAQKSLFKRAGWDDPEKDYSEFIVIGKYKSINKGLEEMQRITLNMTWTKYLKFFKKHYDNSIEDMDRVIDGVIKGRK